jgi:hypothetical protein
MRSAGLLEFTTFLIILIIFPKWQELYQNQAYRNRDAARHGEVGFFGGSSRREMERQMEGKFDGM